MADAVNDVKAVPTERDWGLALADVGVTTESADLMHQSPIDPGRRVYGVGSRVYKIVLSNFQATANLRRLGPREEYELLRRLGRATGIPEVLGYRRGVQAEALILQRVEGVPWEEFRSDLVKVCRTFPRLAWLLVALSLRRTLHGDIKRENVLIDGSGLPWLVDFDQARIASLWASLVGNLFGLALGEGRVHTSLLGFARQLLVQSSPAWLVRAMRFAKRLVLRNSLQRPKLGQLPRSPSEKLRQLHKAWQLAARSQANAPGEGVSYYSLSCEGFLLPGERPWGERWEFFRNAVPFGGQRILELGCNLGLLSTFAKLEGADAVMAVDCDDEILQANHLVQAAYGVNYPVKKVNFDAGERWEDELLDFRPTLVTALSVLNWIRDKQRFLQFLGHFPSALFEGHDSLATEVRRLRSAGFDVVNLVSISERRRVVLLASKTSP